MEKYQKLKILGKGSFGTVYLVQENKKKLRAMKSMKINAFNAEESMKEIRVTEKLLHPNLIRVFQSIPNHETNQIDIIMEYCQGGDLLKYFSENKKYLKSEEILTVFRQIVKAFIFLNVKGVMHRDLKPENVLITNQLNELKIKIADFGCARSIAQDLRSTLGHYTLDTGTPIYASPEQLQNKPYSVKCDIWAGGCLLYFLSFAQHPFKDSTVEKTLQKIKQMTEDRKMQIPINCDPTIREILKITLVYEDKQRATWRQLWLHRFFNQKVNDMISYIHYLRSISNIANWIIKEFWRVKKNYNINVVKNEIFAYFIVKFQYINNIMALEVAKCYPSYNYLFIEGAYKPLKGSQKELIVEIEVEVDSYRKFFESIKTKLSHDESYHIIKQKQTKRACSFVDLDIAIRATYKILLEALPKLKKNSESNSIEYVWLIMARWLNFESWYSYQRKPRIENLMIQEKSIKNIFKEIDVQLEKYNYGIVE